MSSKDLYEEEDLNEDVEEEDDEDEIIDNDDDLKTALEYIDTNWYESSYDWGRTINPIVEVWSHALNLGFRWHKHQLKKNSNKKEGNKTHAN